MMPRLFRLRYSHPFCISSSSRLSMKSLHGTMRFHRVSPPLCSPRTSKTFTNGSAHSEVTVVSSTATSVHQAQKSAVLSVARKKPEEVANQEVMPGNSTAADQLAPLTTA